ncbi:hypothetical protein BaRGS_00030670 [Batillaria attramentaria]|uniref:Uncharacterized protein n=1 Tax=Batillaria attramentaria TaxID=370345 RepID=A0ABD0JTP7_9CAEN
MGRAVLPHKDNSVSDPSVLQCAVALHLPCFGSDLRPGFRKIIVEVDLDLGLRAGGGRGTLTGAPVLLVFFEGVIMCGGMCKGNLTLHLTVLI